MVKRSLFAMFSGRITSPMKKTSDNDYRLSFLLDHLAYNFFWQIRIDLASGLYLFQIKLILPKQTSSVLLKSNAIKQHIKQGLFETKRANVKIKGELKNEIALFECSVICMKATSKYSQTMELASSNFKTPSGCARPRY